MKNKMKNSIAKVFLSFMLIGAGAATELNAQTLRTDGL